MKRTVRRYFMAPADIALLHLSFFLAALPNIGFVSQYYLALVALIAIKIAVFIMFGVYRITYNFVQINEFGKLLLATVIATTASVTAAVMGQMDFALGYKVVGLSLLFDAFLIMISRIGYIIFIRSRNEGDAQPTGRRLRESSGRILIIGADGYAAQLIREIRDGDNSLVSVEAIIDDEGDSIGQEIYGIKIAGGIKDIRLLSRRQNIDEIIIAKPTANRRKIAQLLRECVKTRSKIFMLPLQKTSDASNADVSISDLIKPDINDYLGTDRLKVDHTEINSFIRGQVVLVTGGGGIIGTELSKQILKYKPRRLIAVDADGNNISELVCKLNNKVDMEITEFVPVIASVRDEAAMREVFKTYKPHIVFHAAELKDIPMAQRHPREAFLTNVVGTQVVAKLSSEYSVNDFILLSSTRAGYAKDIAFTMKRLSEKLVLELGKNSRTNCSIVRFSNVMESRGNVLRLFENQIKQGGPVTVTDKDVRRRFVSAETAAVLVLRAASMAESGSVLLLDVGTEMSILELAEAMVRLGGALPYEDVEVVITELRPGEKLFEDGGAEEILAPTSVGRISTVTNREAKEEQVSIDGILAGGASHLSDADVRTWIGKY